MYSGISNAAKAALKSNVVTTTARITLTSGNTVIDGNNLVSVTITDQCYENGVIVGTAMCKEVQIELIDNNYDLADKEFSLEVGVLLPNNTYEYIPYGNFIVKEYNKIVSSNHYNLIAYDYMDKFNKTFVDSNTYESPMTLQQFYQYVANQYGVTIETQANLPNASFSITEKPYFDGMSGRTVLSRIAEMMGCFAKINRNNKLEMRLKNTTSEQFSRAEMNNSLERDNKFGPINVVALRLSQVEGENVTKRDEASITQYGETTLQISDNPFVYTEALRLAAINAIYNKVDGFSYYPTTFNGKLIYLDTGDEVEVQDMSTDTYYKTVILKQVLKIPSTRQSKFENKALTDTGLEYQYTPEQVRLDRRTEYIVDKQNGTITQLVETTEEITGEMIPNLQAQIDGAIQFWNGANIPTLSNYPASDWTTEAERNNHRADIYTVIQDVQGELKQGKSYRFDKVGNVWQWVELTDNELSAVQALANSKAKVFYTTPTVPYNLGDLWLKDGKLYRCKTAKGASGSYSASDWEEAVDYTDDTIALLAQSAAEAAQGTADGAVTAINNIKDTTGQAEGKYIYLDDSSDNTLISLKLNGETTQATRSGKNLFDINGTVPTGTITKYNNGFTLIKGTNRTLTLTLTTPLEAGTYTLSSKIVTNTLTNINKISFNFRTSSSSISIININSLGEATFTLNETATRLYAYINNDQDNDATITLDDIQIESGSTSTAFEQYGASPSPEYPSEIKNLSNTVEIKIINKNLFSGWTKGKGISGTNGIEYTNADAAVSDYIPVNFNVNTNYYVSGLTNTLTSVVAAYNLNKQFLGRTNANPVNYYLLSSTSFTNGTAQGTGDVAYLRVQQIKTGTSTGTIDDIDNLETQLEAGSTVTTYTEHKEQTASFPLAEGQKLYEGSYLAADGIHNTRKQVTFDGSQDEEWGITGIGTINFFYRYRYVLDRRPSSTTVDYCNRFVKANISSSNTLEGFLFLTNGEFRIRFGTEMTVGNFRTWLSNNPTIVEYELAEEEIIPYNAEQQEAWNKIRELHTYKNITNIYSDAYAEIEYAKDNGLDIYETKANANVKYTETIEKFAQQQITNESITNTVSQTVTTVANNYNELKTKFDDYAPKSDVISLQTSVNQVITNTYTKTEVNEKLIDGSVQKVSTTAGTFDSNGLTIEKTDAKTKGNFNEKGITVMDATSGTDEELLFAGYDEDLNETIVRTKNITVEKYLTLKDTVRMEYYENQTLGGHGVGFFIL